MRGQISPNDRLSLRSLADVLGVSVMPVREAVAKLVAEGALVVTRNQSIAIPIITKERLQEITQVRIEVEGYAAEQAALNWTGDFLDQILYL
jgi:DNA-binding GntR family transcriptional regulator